jgi:hypothetical protein
MSTEGSGISPEPQADDFVVTYEIEADFEEEPPEDHFDITCEGIKQMIDKIHERLAMQDVWAWCVVRVHAVILYEGQTYRESSHWLGGCSYENEKDFIENSFYYEDLCDDAVRNVEEGVRRNLYGIEERIARDRRLVDKLGEQYEARKKLRYPDVSSA